MIPEIDPTSTAVTSSSTIPPARSIILRMPTPRKPEGAKSKPGPRTRFPNKTRKPFALCLPPHLHMTLQRTADRLQLKRGDVLCLLLQHYADRLVA